jgi:hypothetical protein
MKCYLMQCCDGIYAVWCIFLSQCILITVRSDCGVICMIATWCDCRVIATLLVKLTATWCDCSVIWLLHDLIEVWCKYVVMRSLHYQYAIVGWCYCYMMWLRRDVIATWCDFYVVLCDVIACGVSAVWCDCSVMWCDVIAQHVGTAQP